MNAGQLPQAMRPIGRAMSLGLAMIGQLPLPSPFSERQIGRKTRFQFFRDFGGRDVFRCWSQELQCRRCRKMGRWEDALTVVRRALAIANVNPMKLFRVAKSQDQSARHVPNSIGPAHRRKALFALDDISGLKQTFPNYSAFENKMHASGGNLTRDF